MSESVVLLYTCVAGQISACDEREQGRPLRDSMHQCMSDSGPLLSNACPSLPQLMCDMRSHLHRPLSVDAPPQGVGGWVGSGSALAGVAEPVDQVPHVLMDGLLAAGAPNTRTRRTLAFPRAVGEHTVTASVGSYLAVNRTPQVAATTL